MKETQPAVEVEAVVRPRVKWTLLCDWCNKFFTMKRPHGVRLFLCPHCKRINSRKKAA